MNGALIVAAFGLLFCSPVPAHADWIQAETENFVFLGEVDADDARAVLEDLETYRSAILALTNTSYFPELRKVRVFGFRNSKKVQDVVDRSNALAVYTTGNDFPVIVTIVSRADRRNRSVILHEYAHHVLGSLTSEYYPRWYNEGFAEYLSSITVSDDIVTLGQPSSEFGALLDRPRWSDIDTVLSAITDYPYDGESNSVQSFRTAMFYGVSWLAVHYLQNSPELNNGFGEYIALLNSGMEPLAAFAQGFGVSPEEFEERLHRYWRADEFPVVQFRMTDNFRVSDVEIRPVTEQQAEIALSLPRALFASSDEDEKKARAGIRKDIAKLLGKHRGETLLYHALMILELREQDFDAAVAAGEKALSMSPDDPLATQTLADALYHRYYDGGRRQRDDIARARSLFRAQLDADSGNPTANSHYPRAVVLDEAEPDEASINAVVFNLRRRRSPVFTNTYLDSAELLARAGRGATACVLLDKIGTWVRSSDADLTNDDRNDIRRKGQETQLERLNRLESELNGCRQ